MILKLSLIIIILLLVIFILSLRKTIKTQSVVIDEQIDKLSELNEDLTKERITHKYTKSQLEMYYKAYTELVDKYNELFNNKDKSEDVVTHPYDMDEILREIADKGIKNVSRDKLDFLRKFGKK